MAMYDATGKNESLDWSGLSPVALAYKLAQLQLEGAPRPQLLIVPNEKLADEVETNLEFFCSFLCPDTSPEVLRLEGWEQGPYRMIQPSERKRFDRIFACHALTQPQRRAIIITTVANVLQASIDRALLQKAFSLREGISIDPQELQKNLLELGYSSRDSVEDPGTFHGKGGIFDIFPVGSDWPIRIDFFDNTIDSVRRFNPETQRSIPSDSPSNTMILPTREFSPTLDNLMQMRERLKNWCDNHDIPKAHRDRISTALEQGILLPEMDYLIPHARSNPCWIADLIPKGCSVYVYEPEQIGKQWSEWKQNQLELFDKSLSKNFLSPNFELLYQEWEAFKAVAKSAEAVDIRALYVGTDSPPQEPVQIHSAVRGGDSKSLAAKIRELMENNFSVVLVGSSQGQIDRLSFLMKQNGSHSVTIAEYKSIPKDKTVVSLTLGNITDSFSWRKDKVAFVSESCIFGVQKVHKKPQKKSLTAANLLSQELIPGDLVVHLDHGIGKYLGLSKTSALGSEGDFALVEYQGGDKLYVPVYRLETLSRYVGSPGVSGVVDKLGSGSFLKTRDKVKKAIKDIAADLIRVQAERKMRPGHAFSAPSDEFYRFEAEFPFEETPDQEKAINDTIGDMMLAQPMDRLICGDVGFGKTEVAIRAAFKAAIDGKQVAVLVPTTILAEQHYLNFSQRMASHPIRVASLSRFKSKKEQTEILKNLEEGKVDVIVGTHRILSKDVKFHDLGLIIIDEEQRFGVEHKERLKQIRATTDVLTLTATPIPRTLQMSLMGLKDVSIIKTPPGDRLSIKTYLSVFEPELIQTAIRSEINRGGQVFFIHNRIQTIGKIEEFLKRLVPEAKVVVAHGQMPEGQLERAMIGFYRKEYDVLLATAIIENGLDVPNANTLIVDRADTFGLSQLYQIRGRVGRSQTRAYAYFLVPDSTAITDDARERLSVLQRFVDLGSGYTIATYDLEIRGGGDVLGQAQSGNIASVGYEMYLELLQSEISRIRGEKIAPPKEDLDINVPYAALIPATYMEDMKSRLIFYRRLSATATEEEVDSLEQELVDRFGEPPKETKELLWVLRLKVLMRRMGIRSLNLGPKGISLGAGKDPVLSPMMVMALVNNYPKEYSVLPEGKLVIRGNFTSSAQVHQKIRSLLSNSLQ